MKAESLADQVELITLSRGAAGLSDGQKDTLRACAKKLRRLDSDDGKELIKLRIALKDAEKNIQEMQADYHV